MSSENCKCYQLYRGSFSEANDYFLFLKELGIDFKVIRFQYIESVYEFVFLLYGDFWSVGNNV